MRARQLVVRLPFWLVAAALAAEPGALAAQSIAAGDSIHLRLLDRLGTDRQARAEVRALVIAPVVDDGRVVLPPGSVVTGLVTGAGMEHDGGKRHWIELRLDRAAIPMGDSASDSLHADVAMRIVAVDDARESIDSNGRIAGPPIPSVIRLKRDWAIFVLGVFHPVGAVILAVTLDGERKARHASVSLDAGTELTAVSTSTTALGGWPRWAAPPVIAVGVVNPASIAASTPFRTRFRTGGAPGDVVAIALVGSPVQMSAAFAAAGWTPAVPMSVRSDFVTFVKAVKGRGYGAQPMSDLLLDGRPPDGEYEKVADTFAKRHHLRMWRAHDAAGNADSTLWLVAATHDVGVMYLAKYRTITHRVDPHIDDERDKIVSDLVAANAVSAMSWVGRTAPPNGAAVNGGHTPVVTDWRMAVLVLRSP